jgi:hypothetical protein
MGLSRFEYRFEFAEKLDFVIVKIGFFVNSSPLTGTGTFSYSCKYVMFTYVIAFAIVSL